MPHCPCRQIEYGVYVPPSCTQSAPVVQDCPPPSMAQAVWDGEGVHAVACARCWGGVVARGPESAGRRHPPSAPESDPPLELPPLELPPPELPPLELPPLELPPLELPPLELPPLELPPLELPPLELPPLDPPLLEPDASGPPVLETPVI
jgi:hypothetical protein